MTLIPKTNREDENSRPAIVKLDLKSACEAMIAICDEVFPGGKLGTNGDKEQDYEEMISTRSNA